MPPPPMPPWADDLDLSLAHGLAMLACGVADRRHGFRTITLATTGLDGAAQLRTVVLRGLDAVARCLAFHTDARSAKLAEIARDPRVSVLAYDPAAKLQLRLWGTAAAHRDDAAADAAWAASRPEARRCYAIQPAPGSPIAAPQAITWDDAAAHDQFVRVAITFDRIEWLWLSSDVHRRARWHWTGAGWRGEWLVP